LQWITRDGLSKESILQWLGDEQMIYRRQERYNNVLLQAALKNGITVLDLREAFLRTRHYESLLCEDGMHPNEQGQALMGAEMQRFMQENESKLFH
ncbi:MAG: SGNH/GDSL hydrolase family protein, partial [Clostridia bacterium]|nr:SGNH/GDSL hydrolase family protein [Clostridia bacterium]